MRDPVRGDAAREARERVAPGLLPRRGGDVGVVAVDDAEEHPDGGVAPAARRPRPRPRGREGELEREALLRVHRDRLARRDAEEVRVEVLDAVDEAGRRQRRGVAVPVDQALGRERHDRVALVAQQPPQRIAVAGHRQPARQPDDRDVVAARSRRPLADDDGGRDERAVHAPAPAQARLAAELGGVDEHERLERSLARVDPQLDVLEVQLAAGQRIPGLEDRLLGAEQQPVPRQALRVLRQGAALGGRSDESSTSRGSGAWTSASTPSARTSRACATAQAR